MEAWLSYTICVSAGILILSLLGCLPDLKLLILGWLLPTELAYRLGVIPGAEQASLLVTLGEILMAVEGVYLVLALFIRFHTR